MATGSHWGYLPCGSRLRFMVLILFWGFARQDFLIGHGYGALGFSSVIYILWLLEKQPDDFARNI